MKLTHVTLAAALLMAFATPAVLAQSADTKAEATSPHKDREHGGEVVKEPKAQNSTRTRKEVQGEAARQHNEGTMQHGGDVVTEPKATKSTRTRKEVQNEAAKQHKEGKMVHGGEVLTEPKK